VNRSRFDAPLRALAALACGTLSTAALAQETASTWPSRPVTIVVPLSPGAAVDIETRLYAQKLAQNTGRGFVVDYKPGAGTTIGLGHVAKSAPDGHTLAAITASATIARLAYPNLPGKARVLGISTAERSRFLSDVPTVAEQGVPGFTYLQWIGIAVPAATPAAIVRRLNEELVKVARDPDILRRLHDDGTIAVASTPERFREQFGEEAARWRKVVAETGVRFTQ
jgi:tripartite-type tricarboxylate transporter receptor subunit TctC